MLTSKIAKLLFLLVLLIPHAVFSQPITLDSTFGNAGIVMTDIGNSDNRAYSMIQVDGQKYVLGGWGHNGWNNDFAIVQYNSDGSLDNSFGNGGIVLTDFDGSQDRVYALAVNASWELIAAGQAVDSGGINNFGLAKYQSDGSLDYAFGDSGKVMTRINGNNSRIHGMVIPDGVKILVVGQSYNGIDGDFAIARYREDGRLDSTFHFDGIQTLDFGSANEMAMSVYVRTDGKIIVLGTSGNQLAITRLNPDGNIDSTFAIYGKTILDAGGGSNVKTSMAIQSDGKILIAGTYYSPGTGRDFLLWRCLEDGTPDSTFNFTGKTVVDFCNSLDEGSSVSIQSDGKIIVTGEAYCGNYSDFAILRFNLDGSLDSTAALGGRVRTDMYGLNEWSYASLIQQDGKLVVGGEGNPGNGYDFAMTRYFTGTGTSVGQPLVSSLQLNAFPNPFEGATTISLVLPEPCLVGVAVYDFTGKEVESFKAEMPEGKQTIPLGSTLRPGPYFVKVIAAEDVRLIRIVKVE